MVRHSDIEGRTLIEAAALNSSVTSRLEPHIPPLTEYIPPLLRVLWFPTATPPHKVARYPVSFAPTSLLLAVRLQPHSSPRRLGHHPQPRSHIISSRTSYCSYALNRHQRLCHFPVPAHSNNEQGVAAPPFVAAASSRPLPFAYTDLHPAVRPHCDYTFEVDRHGRSTRRRALSWAHRPFRGSIVPPTYRQSIVNSGASVRPPPFTACPAQLAL